MFKRRERELKLGQEAAEIQLNDFLDYYDIPFPVEKTDEHVAIVSTCEKLMLSIMAGYLEIEVNGDDIKLEQTLKHPSASLTIVKYQRINGKAKSAMKDRTGEDHHGKIYALMGELSGTSTLIMEGLTGSDLSTMEALGILFLKM